MLKVCGNNEYSQLGLITRKSIFKSYAFVKPPFKSLIDPTTIYCYSVFFEHSVLITKDNILQAAGNNTDGRIIGSLPRKAIKPFTTFEIKDNEGNTCVPISVACGSKYTLYMVLSPMHNNTPQLALSYTDRKEQFPLFLNISGRLPMALFSGSVNAAVVDCGGGILFIHWETLAISPDTVIQPAFLPNGEKPVKIACGTSILLVLSDTGRVYESITEDIKFVEVPELQGIECIDVAGSTFHFFAISKDGKVYGKGYNSYGRLGFPNKDDHLESFTYIKSLSQHKIIAASASVVHSLFKTVDSKLLALGDNEHYAVFFTKPQDDPMLCFNTINDTPAIILPAGVSAFIAGIMLTVAFMGCVPKNMPNQKITHSFTVTPKINPITSANCDDIELLKKENARLRNEIKLLQEKIINLESNEKAGITEKTTKNKSRNLISILDSDYLNELKQIELIGKGGQSKVFKVAHDQYFALKEIEIPKKNEDAVSNMKNLLKEYEIINFLDHPNIIRSIGIFFGDEFRPPSLLLEYCPYDMSHVVKTLSDVERVTSIYEICSAMKKVHESKVIHRDLKPENILLDENKHVKVSDFGVSHFDDNNSTYSKTAGIGTLKYMAPELLNGNTHYDEKVDVYSFGIVFFFILTKGQLPEISLADVIMGKAATIPDYINALSRNLIKSCWSLNPEKRPSFSEIIDVIQNNDFKLIDGIEKEIGIIRNFLSL